MVIGINATVKMTIVEGGNVLQLERLVAAEPQTAPQTPLPISRGHGQISGWCKIPLVLANLVETLVIEHCQKRGLGEFAIRCLYLQPPLFVLSRCQTITEGLPSHCQPLVGHGTHDGLLVTVALTVLDPGIGQQQAIAVFFFVSELTVQQTGTALHRATLQNLVPSIDAIDNVQVGI